ncbi:MAG: DUF975 family protein [Lachnospiraceae bacterium]|nr:DUF975 family protein [Lachnospiraceae bacterium]
MKTSSELRFLSLQKLNGKYGMTIAVTITVIGCSLALSWILDIAMSPDSMFSLMAFEIVVFLSDLLLGVLVSGQAYIYLNIAYDKEVSYKDLKKGFTEHPERAAILRIPFALAATAAALPLHIYQLFFWESQNRDVLFICMLAALAGAMAEIAVELYLSQVFFLMHDFPDRSAKEIFLASIKLMKGQKFRYFMLILGYIPWLFLSAFLLFIPALFVMSQMYTAQAFFYRNLTEKR